MQANPLTTAPANAFAPFARASADAVPGKRANGGTAAVRPSSKEHEVVDAAGHADAAIRARVLAVLAQQPGWSADTSNVFVSDGVVVLQGLFRRHADRRATCLAARHAVGVLGVRDCRVPVREWQALA